MTPRVALLVFGATLCAALAGIIAFYCGRRRRGRVEDPKYRMLDDDDR